MMSAKIFVATTSFGKWDSEAIGCLTSSGLETVLNPLGRTLEPKEVSQYANGCVGIIAGTERYSRETLSGLPNLKAISRCGTGLDGIDLVAAEELGISVSSTPYGPTQAAAELAIGMILSLIRHVEDTNAKLKRGIWEKQMGFLLRELRIGIVGLGKIGKRVAALLKVFDPILLGFDINPDYRWAESNDVSIKQFDDLLRESDVLSLHLTYDKSSHHLIGERELSLMKEGSYLVNTSRGGLVDEGALYRALESKMLRGAALDTFEREPYDGPLREFDNVILTPHVGSYAKASRLAMEREAVENLICQLKHHCVIK